MTFAEHQKRIRLGILGSTRGTNLLAIQNAILSHQLPATIEIVISNKPNAFILERAAALGLPTEFIDSIGLSREAYDQQLTQRFKDYAVDLIVLIGFMRILSQDFVTAWNNKIINIHPSLLPAFAGKMDLAVHEAVLQSGVKETGCTVHFVTQEVDAGPIVIQSKCAVLDNDTPDSLKQRVQALEGLALIGAIQKVAGGLT